MDTLVQLSYACNSFDEASKLSLNINRKTRLISVVKRIGRQWAVFGDPAVKIALDAAELTAALEPGRLVTYRVFDDGRCLHVREGQSLPWDETCDWIEVVIPRSLASFLYSEGYDAR